MGRVKRVGLLGVGSIALWIARDSCKLYYDLEDLYVIVPNTNIHHSSVFSTELSRLCRSIARRDMLTKDRCMHHTTHHPNNE